MLIYHHPYVRLCGSEEPSLSTATGEVGSVLDEITYLYGNESWGDLLTSYDGNTITYGTIGNPLSDGTWTYTWEQGRQLTKMQSSSVTWNYNYNSDGLRIGRTNGTDTYTYWYDGNGRLLRMKYNDIVMSFSYSASGQPMSITYNGAVYYYLVNAQGDVVGLINSTGVAVVQYTYDAWGRLLSTSGTAASTLGINNPLRYRSYIYDTETGLYYLQSRYYNPTWGRFINADNQLQYTSLGLNMFAYCLNNPANMFDASGEFPVWLIPMAIVSLISGISNAATTAKDGGDFWDCLGSGVIGAASGAIGFGIAWAMKGSPAGYALGRMASSVFCDAGTTLFLNGEITSEDWGRIGVDVVMDTCFSVISNYYTEPINGKFLPDAVGAIIDGIVDFAESVLFGDNESVDEEDESDGLTIYPSSSAKRRMAIYA